MNVELSMNEAAVEEETMQSEEQVPTQGQATAGVLLRQAREAARMQLPVMAATLKVPQHKLEALEADDYAAFPDHVFMRALAMGMCRTLHIDAESVLAKLPRTEIKSLANRSWHQRDRQGAQQLQGHGYTAGLRQQQLSQDCGRRSDSAGSCRCRVLCAIPADGGRRRWGRRASAGSGPVWPDGSGERSGCRTACPGRGRRTGQFCHTAAPVTEPVSGCCCRHAWRRRCSKRSRTCGSCPNRSPGSRGSHACDRRWRPAGAEGEYRPVLGQGQGRSGKVVLEKTLSKDESATAEGQLPLSVIVGNAKGTQVTVRGEPFDISSTRDNVARFEVK
jgi:cytoskeleton protein RodZ